MTVVSVELAIFPVSEVQGCAAAVVAFPAESTVVVVKVQAQVTLRFVAPLTMEVRVMDCDTMMVAAAGLTATVTTLVLLLPPQPARARTTIALRLRKSRE